MIQYLDSEDVTIVSVDGKMVVALKKGHLDVGMSGSFPAPKPMVFGLHDWGAIVKGERILITAAYCSGWGEGPWLISLPVSTPLFWLSLPPEGMGDKKRVGDLSLLDGQMSKTFRPPLVADQ